MKKPFIILFLLLYLALNVGVNIAIHTCGGASEALLVTSEAKDPCGDGMPMQDMCCTTELKTVKLDDSQKVSLSAVEEKLLATIEVPVVNVSPLNNQPSSFVILTDISPPPHKDFQISNSIFLI
ncbi:MAG: hypothetical protein PHP42_02895 [Bacteroidota bacterium]|nr:hypothetical protein [Bacteroidota bacterium]